MTGFRGKGVRGTWSERWLRGCGSVKKKKDKQSDSFRWVFSWFGPLDTSEDIIMLLERSIS